jgi:hypothetical protein
VSSQAAFFTEVIRLLKKAKIPCMVCGSLASSVHGRPRSTIDIDFVIDPNSEQLEAFIAAVPEGWYVSLEAARGALTQQSMFNVVDAASGWKADFIVRKDRPFSRAEFQRRQKVRIFRRSVDVAAAEDVILSKLEWSKDAGSERQYGDALGVAQLRGEQLDRTYLQKWAKDLGVEEELARLLAEAALLDRKGRS